MSTERTGLDWWMWRDSLEGVGREAAEASWQSWHYPHRKNIALALRLVHPFHSLYEIGCQAGPNLRLALSLFPGLEVGGCEPAETACEYARKRLEVSIDRLSWPFGMTRHYDVFLSCYTLAYVSPDQIHASIATMCSHAEQAIILLEPMAWGAIPAGLCRNDQIIEYRHNYHELLRAEGWRIAWAWPLAEPVQNANAILVATLAD